MDFFAKQAVEFHGIIIVEKNNFFLKNIQIFHVLSVSTAAYGIIYVKNHK